MTEQRGERFFTARPAKGGGFVAWCAKTCDLGDGPLDVGFLHEVHFQFANTAEAALAAIKMEVLN